MPIKKLSTSILTLIASVAALTQAGVLAAIDGDISVVSSDPAVLQVEPLDDGTFKFTVIGVGLATITVSGDADLGDGVKPVSQDFSFEVYDGASEADHFDLALSQIVRKDELEQPTAEAIEQPAEEDTAAI